MTFVFCFVFSLFVGGFGKWFLKIFVKWMSHCSKERDQYPGMIYYHVPQCLASVGNDQTLEKNSVLGFLYCISTDASHFAYVLNRRLSTVTPTRFRLLFLYVSEFQLDDALRVCPTSVRCCLCLLHGF